jgi:hypothetical protein
MSLTLDAAPIDLGDWDTEVAQVNDWLAAMWGVRPGESSPTSRPGSVPPDCLAAASWLVALWGISA